jgi:hypothetical protein
MCAPYIRGAKIWRQAMPTVCCGSTIRIGLLSARLAPILPSETSEAAAAGGDLRPDANQTGACQKDHAVAINHAATDVLLW